MTLAEYIAAQGRSAAAFGREIGISSRVRIHRLVRGHRFPTPDEIRRIREATGGAVTADDFVDQHTASAEVG